MLGRYEMRGGTRADGVASGRSLINGIIARAAPISAMALVASAVWYFRTRHLDAEMALHGHSPEQVAVLRNHPEWFAGDFPSGAIELLKSLIYHIYPLAEAMGVPVVAAWQAMIGLEIALYTAAVAYAARRLLPGASWPLTAIAAVLCAGSTVVSPDLASLHFPFFGWVYGFTLAFFLLAVAEAAHGRWLAAAIMVTIAYVIHPINGVFTGAFIAAMLLARWADGGRPSIRDLIIPGLTIAIGCGAWTLWIASQSTISAGQVESEVFVALTRAQNFHWYPVFLGVFWEGHSRNFVPLMSTLALLAWSLGSAPKCSSGIDRQLVAGIAAMLVLTVIGVIVSVAAPAPVLIKLALHRADRNALLVGVLLIVRALYRDLIEGDRVERGLAAILLLAPFQSQFGIPPGPALLRLGYHVYSAARIPRISASTVVAGMLAAAIVVLLGVYHAAGLVTDPAAIHYLGLNKVLVAAGAIAALWPLGWPLRDMAALAAVTWLALVLSPTADRLSRPTVKANAYAALEAQLWAKSNTLSGSLFMIDPGLSYMWRDKSHRPSFGTVREWLLISIMYNSRRDLLTEGFKRYQALGLGSPDYIFDQKARRMQPLLRRITSEARERYYAMDRGAFERLARQYGIRYFVFDKSKIKKEPPLATVYENSHYLIASAP